jgi:putative alpha-1,2-mannosidase
LKDNLVTVELTATEHVGVHRYSYHPQASQKVVLFDIRQQFLSKFITIPILDSN